MTSSLFNPQTQYTENVDAIRAMFNLESNNMKSILKTNKALGID